MSQQDDTLPCLRTTVAPDNTPVWMAPCTEGSGHG
jgi:hypothetical protein